MAMKLRDKVATITGRRERDRAGHRAGPGQRGGPRFSWPRGAARRSRPTAWATPSSVPSLRPTSRPPDPTRAIPPPPPASG